MAVEEARHVLSGDWITLNASSICCPEMEVTATEHSRRCSVIWVRLVGLCCKRFEFLPDDPVKVVHYANEGGRHMTHTPGPWRVTEWPGVSGDTHFGIDAQKWRLAIVHSGNADDATLMAAAPDLLAALRLAKAELIELYEEKYPDDESDNDITAAIDAAIAAIAKAEGRPDDQ